MIDIEEALSHLWECPENLNKIKACLFNLVIFTRETKRAQYFQEILEKIIESSPSRVIFIKSGSELPEDLLKIEVSTESAAKGEFVAIACEEIMIQAGGNELDKIPFLVMPHFVPDLPIYLLWGEDPTADQKIFPYLAPYAKRLVFESDSIEDLQSFSKKMLDMLERMNLDIVDMTWGRIVGWRRALAQTFDSVYRIRQLSECNAVRINYNSRQTGPICNAALQSIYFQAWLAAQLNWNFESYQEKDSQISLIYKNKSNKITIEIKGIEVETIFPGAIYDVEIDTSGHLFQMQRSEHLSQVIVHISTKETCELPFIVSLPSLQQTPGFMREFIYQQPSDHYSRMLETISQVAWKKRNQV